MVVMVVDGGGGREGDVRGKEEGERGRRNKKGKKVISDVTLGVGLGCNVVLYQFGVNG